MQTPVNSSMIRWIEFDDNLGLTVCFQNGDCWRYAKVPRFVYDGLANAHSKGTFFNNVIKGKYEGTKVTQQQT